MKKLLFALLLATTLTACGGDDSTPSPTPSVNATGNWHGSYNSSISGVQTMRLNLQQNSASVTGTYSSSTGALGSVSGSVSEDIARVTITVTTPGCSGSFGGTGIIATPQSGTATMIFSYSGSSTCGGQESGTGYLTKQ